VTHGEKVESAEGKRNERFSEKSLNSQISQKIVQRDRDRERERRESWRERERFMYLGGVSIVDHLSESRSGGLGANSVVLVHHTDRFFLRAQISNCLMLGFIRATETLRKN
jgi:hypothetical protein